MIALDTLAEQLETRLNDKADMYGLDGGITENVSYRFRIVLDTADYKDAEREDNKVTMYIHGIMTSDGANVEGTSGTAYNASLNARVEFLLPFLFTASEGKNDLLTSIVRDILTDVLQSSTGVEIFDNDRMYSDNGILFYQGTKFSIPLTGERAERPKVGDSLTLSLAINYFFIAYGVGSRRVKYEVSTYCVHYETVGYTNAEMVRQSIQDGNLFSEDAKNMSNGQYPSSKVTTSGSVLTVKFVSPTRLSTFDRLAAQYLLQGYVTPLYMRISVPYSTKTDGAGSLVVADPLVAVKRMTFSQASLAAQLDYNAASTMTLVEAATDEIGG